MTREYALHDQHGQAMVEFALILPVFLLFFFGLTELGRAVWLYNTLSHVAREGSRFAIVLSQYREHGDQRCQSGNTSGSYTDLAAYQGSDTVVGHALGRAVGLDPETLTIEVSSPLPGCSPLEGYWRDLPFTVRASFPFQPLVADFLGVPATIQLAAEATMRAE